MRLIASAAISLAAIVGLAVGVAAEPIGGSHGRDEIKQTCAANGGSYWSNLDRYGCFKPCTKDGKTCAVVCENDGKCEGHTPSAAVAGGTVRPGLTVSGVLTFRGSTLQRAP